MFARIRKSMDERDEGFTLIELLVVMIVIGILAAIAIPVFLNQRKKAIEAAAKTEVSNIGKEMMAYMNDEPLPWYYDQTSTRGAFTMRLFDFTGALITTFDVKASSGTNMLITPYTPGSGIWCIVAYPDYPGAADYSFGNNGLFKSSTCS